MPDFCPPPEAKGNRNQKHSDGKRQQTGNKTGDGAGAPGNFNFCTGHKTDQGGQQSPEKD